MRHVISVLVENHFGVLSRISNMFANRGFNIDSLAVGTTQDVSISRITLVSQGDDTVIEQIIKQLKKLCEVIRVEDLTDRAHVERELALVKVRCDKRNRAEIMQLVNIFRARIIDVGQKAMTVEVVGGRGKVDTLLEQFEVFGVLELARTGSVGLERGEKTMTV